MDLKRGIDKAIQAIVAELKKISKPTTTNKEIAQVEFDLGQLAARKGRQRSFPMRWKRSARRRDYR